MSDIVKAVMTYGVIGVLAVILSGFVGSFFSFLGSYAIVGTVIVAGVVKEQFLRGI